MYLRCKSWPVHIKVIKAHWRLFGNVLRLPRDVPDQLFVDEYFRSEPGVDVLRGRPRITLLVVLDRDLKTVGKRLHSTAGLDYLRLLLFKEGRTELTGRIVKNVRNGTDIVSYAITATHTLTHPYYYSSYYYFSGVSRSTDTTSQDFNFSKLLIFYIQSNDFLCYRPNTWNL